MMLDPYRRVLMTPAMILGTWFFTDFITEIDIAKDFKKFIMDGLAYLKTHSMDTVIENVKNMPPEVSFSIFMIFMVLCGILAQYVLFIIAPRKVAGSAGSFFQWFIRFLLYMGGVIFNVGFLEKSGY
jgi:hypothetical protein